MTIKQRAIISRHYPHLHRPWYCRHHRHGDTDQPPGDNHQHSAVTGIICRDHNVLHSGLLGLLLSHFHTFTLSHFAGITMYSPLAYWDAKNGGKRVGIIGIGGLGQMGVSWLHAIGWKYKHQTIQKLFRKGELENIKDRYKYKIYTKYVVRMSWIIFLKENTKKYNHNSKKKHWHWRALTDYWWGEIIQKMQVQNWENSKW